MRPSAAAPSPASLLMLYITPDRYIQVRRMNGISWARSVVLLPSRATISARPVLKTALERAAPGSPAASGDGQLAEVISTMTTSTNIEIEQLLELHAA